MQVLDGRNPLDGVPIEVTFEDGVVTDIRSSGHETDRWLSAGFIDLQVNGFGGEDVNADDLDPNMILRLTKNVIATGVTTFLPTVITSSEEKIVEALRTIAEARRCSAVVAHAVPYVHIEGPHISPTDGPRGAHPRNHVRPPSLAEFNRWQEASGGLVGMITLSPHFAEAEEYIAAVTKRGVVVALGHTDATPEEISKAVNAGARLSTHLGNGIGATLPRHPNVLWTQLADDRLSATMIADGHHLPPDTLKVMVRAKGVARSILISDAVAVAGQPPGVYGTPVGGRVELHPDGRLSLAGTPYLAGAALPLKDGVARICQMAGVSLTEALTMATVNPGRFVGGRGILQRGSPADLIQFTLDEAAMALCIVTVVVGGKVWDLASDSSK
jgi:N-acetylglucosamine-6-phosphate deacetylase